MKKIVGIIVCSLLIISFSHVVDATTKNIYVKNSLSIEGKEDCAGAIATGSVVKNGRSIFWKNRHMTDENNKPYFYQGPVYKFYGIGQHAGTYMGMNEKGLAVGNFAVSGPLDNWEYISDGTYGQTSPIMNYLLGNFDSVKDAAIFAALHMGGCSQLGIISSEYGVGAIVAVSDYDGTCRTNITWINNTYAALANAFYCDGDYDVDGNDITIDNMLDDIVNNGGINGDFKIDWEEVCQRGGKNVSGKEEGTGTFTCYMEITKATCVSGFVAVSGNSSFDGAANIGWLAMGRQPLVGIWLPLGASCLFETGDIPFEYRAGGGIEDYVDPKVFYATNGTGQGSNIYYCERVREILECTNSNETYMFNEFDIVMEDIPPEATPSEVKSIIYSFVEEMVPDMITGYESLNHQPNPPIINGPTRVKNGEEYDYILNSTDPDGNPVIYFIDWGDNNNESTEYCDSGEEIILKHSWNKKGKYTIFVKSKDTYDEESIEVKLEITVPRTRASSYLWYEWVLERFPLLEKLLNLLR